MSAKSERIYFYPILLVIFVVSSSLLSGCKALSQYFPVGESDPPKVTEPKIVLSSETYSEEIKELQQKRYDLLAENLQLNIKMKKLQGIVKTFDERIKKRQGLLDSLNKDYSGRLQAYEKLKTDEQKLQNKITYLNQQIERKSKADASVPQKIVCNIVADNYIIEKNDTINRGTAEGISVGYSGDYKTLKALIKADLSAIPDNARIVKAVLKYCCYFKRFDKKMKISLFPASKDWSELESSWKNSPKEYSDAIATTTIDDNDAWYSWDITSQVKKWIAEKGSNHGLIMTGADVNNKAPNYSSFNSKESKTKPLLEVHFLTD